MYLGLDLGTSELKALLLDERHNIVGTAHAPLTVQRPQPGWSEQHPADWWSALEQVMDTLHRRVRSLSDVPGRFDHLGEVTLVASNGKSLVTRVTHVRSGGPTLIVGFEAFATPEHVAEFRGGLVQVPRGDSPALPADQYYQCDLIGMVVQDESGTVLGTLEEVLAISDNQAFLVRQDGKELLIPAAKQIVVAVDVAGRVMTVRLPEGFGDL